MIKLKMHKAYLKNKQFITGQYVLEKMTTLWSLIKLSTNSGLLVFSILFLAMY